MTDAERWVVYVLRCRGDRLYCGITKDVEARFADHVAGKGAKFTRAFPPHAVIALKRVASKPEALREERGFKALPRIRKLEQLAEWQAAQDGREPRSERANAGQTATAHTPTPKPTGQA